MEKSSTCTAHVHTRTSHACSTCNHTWVRPLAQGFSPPRDSLHLSHPAPCWLPPAISPLPHSLGGPAVPGQKAGPSLPPASFCHLHCFTYPSNSPALKSHMAEDCKALWMRRDGDVAGPACFPFISKGSLARLALGSHQLPVAGRRHARGPCRQGATLLSSLGQFHFTIGSLRPISLLATRKSPGTSCCQTH